MKQLNIFELTKPKYKITKPIRLIELFAGIGSQAKALKNIGANFEHYRVIEFDEYAIASYNAIHNTNFAPLDITKITAKDLGIVETDKYDYIMTYSFPCQDLSTAGKRKGMKKGSGTRSGLLWEVEYLLSDLCGFKEHRVPPGNSKYLSIAEWVDDYNYDIDKSKLPQILLMENVPQVIGEKNLKDFREWQLFLEKLGYSSYFKLLNAKDYEIPQNRNRCFMVSILGDYYYGFPRKRKLKLRLKDFLEDEVDEKYYLSDKMKAYFTDMTNRNGFVRGEKFNPHTLDSKYAYTITTRAGSRETDNYVVVGGLYHNTSPAFTRKPLDEMARTIKCDDSSGIINYETLRIRKLTPKECWRLMGFTDEDFEKARKVNSDTQLYKQAGNSIVVKVLERIFEEFI